jgi:hypothetical protein
MEPLFGAFFQPDLRVSVAGYPTLSDLIRAKPPFCSRLGSALSGGISCALKLLFFALEVADS